MKNIVFLLLLFLLSNNSFSQEVFDEASMTLEAGRIINEANARIVKSDTLIEFKTKEIQESEVPIIEYRWKTIEHYDSENRLVMKEQKMLNDPPTSHTMIPSLAVWDTHNNCILERYNDSYDGIWLTLLKYDDKGILLEKKFWNNKKVAKMVSDNSNNEIKRTEEINGNVEIKTNFVFLPFGLAEASVERIVNTFAMGISGSFATKNPEEVGLTYLIVPYCRFYLGKKKAAGFFIEINSAVMEQWPSFYSVDDSLSSNSNSTTNFGLGFAIGAKFINHRGYLLEMVFGAGHLFNIKDTSLFGGYLPYYPRIGLSIGKRF